jgi:hypothetical protein
VNRLKKWLLALLWVLYSLAIGWVIALIRLIKDQQRRRDHRRRLRERGDVFTRCQVIPPDVYRRPDPLIYSQSYLMSLGLSVTWDNPDIQLFDVAGGFTPVPSSALQADTEYEIRATIYNGSTAAPAVGMPVEFSFLSFGIGTTSTAIGATVVDLPVKGAPGHPATAAVRWRTPATPGHYCIQVKLVWADDANPANNLGQENTNVGTPHSPAVFQFPVRNVNVVRQTLHLVPDSYTPLEPIDCDDWERGRKEHGHGHGHGRGRRRGHENGKNGRGDENGNEDWCRELRRRHDRENFAVEPGWNVRIAPNPVDLGPGDSQEVTVTVDPPAGFTGTKAINVNALDPGNTLVGGVTLYVVRS